MSMDPGMDGLEAWPRILDIRPGQKAIIVSGFSETERVGKFQEFGADNYVQKTYIMERIGVAIRARVGDKSPALSRPSQDTGCSEKISRCGKHRHGMFQPALAGYSLIRVVNSR